MRTLGMLLLGFLLAGRMAGVAGTQQSEESGTHSAGTLEAALTGMDRAAARFTGVTADLDYTKVTVIVDDHSTDRGTVAFAKKNGEARVMLAFQEPAERFVLFEGNKVSLYRPRIAEVEVYEIGNRQGLVEQFLLLGFGTPGQELQNRYQITWHGEDSLDGERVVHLELVPKSEQAAARLARIELWLSPENWQPLQQRFWEPSGDYMIARYTNLKLNPNIPDRAFRLPLRGNVRTVNR